MKRESFLAAVHELAEQLGRQLFAIVQKQSERARAQALELAKDQLRAELEGTHAEEAGPDAVEAKRAPRAASRAALHQAGQRGRRSAPRGGRAGGGEPDRPDRARDQQDTNRGSRKARGPQRCRKCVAAGRKGLGHNARTCTGEQPATDDEAEDESPPEVADVEREAPPLSSSPKKSAIPPRVHRCLRAPRLQAIPPGWTAESDRREEMADLSMLTVLRKTS